MPDACTAFHKYPLTWTANPIQIGVDGVVCNPHDKPTGADASPWPFDVPQYLLLNLAMGGNLGGPVAAGFSTDSLQVDCLPVHQRWFACAQPTATSARTARTPRGSNLSSGQSRQPCAVCTCSTVAGPRR